MAAEEKTTKQLKWRTQLQKKKRQFETGNLHKLSQLSEQRKLAEEREAKKEAHRKKKHQQSTENWLASAPVEKDKETHEQKSIRQAKLDSEKETRKAARKAARVAFKAAAAVREATRCLQEILHLFTSNREVLMPHLGDGAKFGVPLTFAGLKRLKARLAAQEERKLQKELREHKERTQELAQRARYRRDHVKRLCKKAKWYISAIKIQRFFRRKWEKRRKGKELRLKLYTTVIPGVIRVQRTFKKRYKNRRATATKYVLQRCAGLKAGEFVAVESAASADGGRPPFFLACAYTYTESGVVSYQATKPGSCDNGCRAAGSFWYQGDPVVRLQYYTQLDDGTFTAAESVVEVNGRAIRYIFNAEDFDGRRIVGSAKSRVKDAIALRPWEPVEDRKAF
jgi:hypothetical protein